MTWYEIVSINTSVGWENYVQNHYAIEIMLPNICGPYCEVTYKTLLIDYKYASEWIYCEQAVLHMTTVDINSWHAYGHGLILLFICDPIGY